jgi:hypothetical protein
MKTYPNLPALAKAWVEQESPAGKTNNAAMFFIGQTIYSWRNSWPLATMRDSRVIINEERISTSTSKHLRKVKDQLKRCWAQDEITDTAGLLHLVNKPASQPMTLESPT